MECTNYAKVERDIQVLGVRRWKKMMTDRKKWKDRPKLTPGRSASGRIRIRIRRVRRIRLHFLSFYIWLYVLCAFV
jgi:hypothetical protein